MSRYAEPTADEAAAVIGGVVGALTWEGGAPTALQLQLLDSILRRFGDGTAPGIETFHAWEPQDVAKVLVDPRQQRQLAHMVVTLELLLHPLPPGLEHHAERYLAAAGITTPYLSVVRDTARHHLLRLHADLLRNSWYTEQTIHGIFKGRLGEMARSKLSYYSVGRDRKLAARWRALEDCPEGSWGHTVSQFYRIHGFAYPGEHEGIYEVGALHDWIHVLADYGTSPEGEIDVFAFLAETMADERGFIQFVFTLALFQNASVDTVGGRKVVIARADTLSDPLATDRLAGALHRASKCTVDVMGGIDHFALADRPLAELREEWNIEPKRVPSPGALDVP